MSSIHDSPSKSVRYLPTNEAYDRWAAVYDTDGNFLQALDTIEIKTLLPKFLFSITSPKPWRIVDLGCGTGRNTALLLNIPGIKEVVALDSSKGMLEVARTRLQKMDVSSSISIADSAKMTPKLHLEVFDMLASSSPPTPAQQADGVISTLVVEHVPLSIFFSQASQILKPGGALLLTNMHEHMGSISQAGFVDTKTGEKIRPTSYVHTVEDVIAEADKHGFDIEMTGEQQEGIRERTVEDHMVEMLGPRSKKWVGVMCWFGGVFRKRGN
ncbi:putative methyltransferase [Daldinia sp. FL1419]|nr:putative methyltransferase [Daldinia sp. FL1419]